MIKAISDIGLQTAGHEADTKQIRLTNWLAFLSIVISLIYFSVFLGFVINEALLIELLAALIYGSVLIFSKINQFIIGRFIFILTLFAHMVLRSLCYGEESQIHLLLIPIATIPLILFNLKQKAYIFILVAIGIICFMCLYLYDFKSIFLTPLPDDLAQGIRFTSYITAISTQGAVMFEIISNYEKNEKILDENYYLLQSQLKSIFENSFDALFLVDWDERRILRANKRAVEMFEFDNEASFFDRYGSDLHANANNTEEIAMIRKQLVDDGRYEDEILYRTAKGRLFWGAIAIIVIEINGKKYQSVRITDISEKKKNKIQIENSLKEKQILLAEIHHRVKNNLAIISSLLSLQANYLTDEKAKQLFLESCNRIHSMALIHDKLYHNETFANIDFCFYIKDLINHIKQSHHEYTTKVNYEVECVDVFMDMKNAIPCGLILNELISNVYKHAFVGRYEGNVRILCVKEESGIRINFSDDGKGFNVSGVLENLNSLGLTLVTALVDQIDGQLHVSSNNGTNFDIRFRE